MGRKIIITEEQLASLIKRGRGRPRKVVDTDLSPRNDSTEKRGRGRPRKVVDPNMVSLKKNFEKKGRGRPRKNFEVNEKSRDPYVPNWSHEQNLIAFYCYKFGSEKLEIGPKRDTDGQLREIANHYIGTVSRSLKMQMSNFNYLDTLSTGNPVGYSDYSKTQKEVYEKYESVPEEKMREDILEYFNTLNTDEIFRIFMEKYNKIHKIKEKEKQQKNLDLSNDRAKEFEKTQLRMKGLNPEHSKAIGGSKRNLIDYIRNGNLLKKFAVLFDKNMVRVFKTEPSQDNTTFGGKLFNDAPDTKSPNYNILTGKDILDMIVNDPIEAALDNRIYESEQKKIRLTTNEFKNVISKSIHEDNHKEINNVLKKVITESSKSSFKNRIYRIIEKSKITTHIYHDDTWDAVKDLINLIRRIDGVIDVNYGTVNGGYKENSEGTKWKEYEVEIETVNGTISGNLKAHAAGSVEDPFDGYDITLVLW